MKQPALVIIKPDGMNKSIMGEIIKQCMNTGLDVIASRVIRPSRSLVEDHYQNISKKPFFKQAVNHLMGKYHKISHVLAIVFYGEGAVKKLRKLAGATNPEEADPKSIRGQYGRVTSDGLFENVVHVSSTLAEAKREIRLWFGPGDFSRQIFKAKMKKVKSYKQRVWG